MPNSRRSAQWSDQIDSLQDEVRTVLGLVQEIVSSPAVVAAMPPAIRSIVPVLADGVGRIEQNIGGLRATAMVLDDGLRAIGAIAHAGPDTTKVTRTLREIVRDQELMRAQRASRVVVLPTIGGEPWTLTPATAAQPRTGIAS